MSESAQKRPVNIPAPVQTGAVVANMITELTSLCRELDQHRLLASDLAAWFKAHPDLDHRFGAFQQLRNDARAAARRPTAPEPAKNAKRLRRR